MKANKNSGGKKLNTSMRVSRTSLCSAFNETTKSESKPAHIVFKRVVVRRWDCLLAMQEVTVCMHNETKVDSVPI